ncbi:MAG TPA: Fic family protein [Holophagaceae bacterium]|jgi:Fic family protein|nr:Fic family protein [Holophagaceae bacterium]
MKRLHTGTYAVSTTSGEAVKAFVPDPLPPQPPIEWTPRLLALQQRAALALGRLDGVTSLLPDPALFIYAYVRKEAVLSSQIEGTQSSLSDLLAFENDQAPGVPLDDVMEVSCYVAALNHGLKRLREGLPLSLRLVKEIHGVLLSSGRGSGKQPGEFRQSQNWIGGSRPGNAAFVPPPHDALPDCLKAWERFLHDDPVAIDTLTKAALAHVQFETLHPFLDGNGRVGRLLIALLLHAEGALAQPLLYLSLYFKRHRDVYYDLLQGVRLKGDWEAWLDFFFQGVEETAAGAVDSAHRLLALFAEDRARIQKLGRSAGSVLQVHHALQSRPIGTVAAIAPQTGLAQATIYKALDHLVTLGIAREITGSQRNRLFAYDRVLQLLTEGTEL